MSLLLRIEMILIAIAVIMIVLFSVNRKKMCIQYSLIWIVLSVGLLIVAIFPSIAFFLCDILDIQTPTNLIFLVGILALLMIAFYQTIIISKQSERIKFLIQTISLEKYNKGQEETDESK